MALAKSTHDIACDTLLCTFTRMSLSPQTEKPGRVAKLMARPRCHWSYRARIGGHRPPRTPGWLGHRGNVCSGDGTNDGVPPSYHADTRSLHRSGGVFTTHDTAHGSTRRGRAVNANGNDSGGGGPIFHHAESPRLHDQGHSSDRWCLEPVVDYSLQRRPSLSS